MPTAQISEIRFFIGCRPAVLPYCIGTTMSNLVPFSFGTASIRVIDNDGTPWFVLRDLLDAIQTTTPTSAAVASIKAGLGEGFTAGLPLQTNGGLQEVTIVAEAAATYLLSRSNTEKGKELNRFIHVEVLPSIRQTGAYALPAPSSAEYLVLLAHKMLDQERGLAELERKHQKLAQEHQETATKVKELVGGEGFYTITAYAHLQHRPVDNATANKFGKQAAALCRERSLPIGKAKHPLWGEVNTYPEGVLSEVMAEEDY